MIKIKKSREPRKLELYRQTPGATYADMDNNLKQEVIASLLNEQGHLYSESM